MFAKKILVFVAIILLAHAFQAIGQNNPGQADVLYQKARTLAYDRKYSEAIDTLKSAYAYDPENRRAILLMGNIYIKMGNLPGAEQAFNQLRSLDPQKPEGYIKLAEVYWYWERYTQAMEFLRTASKLSNPPDAGVFHWKGQIFRSINEPQHSDSILKEGLKYYPDNPLLLANYGATRIVMGDTSGAFKYIDSAYTIDSNSRRHLIICSGRWGLTLTILSRAAMSSLFQWPEKRKRPGRIFRMATRLSTKLFTARRGICT
jgi:tetratricopeptide (TPR) repeat protein